MHAVQVARALGAVVGGVATQLAFEATPTEMAHRVTVQVGDGAVMTVTLQAHQLCVVDHSTDSVKVLVADTHQWVIVRGDTPGRLLLVDWSSLFEQGG